MTNSVRLKDRKDPKPQLGLFAEALEEAMNKKGLDTNMLSQSLSITYEHTRKLLKSMTFPSTLLQEKVCRVLGLNPVEINKLVVADKIKHKYGSVPQELAGKTVRYEHLERQLPKLTEDQFRTLQGVVDGMVRSNRH